MTGRDGEEKLDVSGLKCPLPVLKTGKVLRNMAPGQVLKVLATDPMAAIDMPHFCSEQGYELIESRKDGEILTFRIRRK